MVENRGKSKHRDFIGWDFAALVLAYVVACLLRYDHLTIFKLPTSQIVAMTLAFISANLLGNPFKNVLKRGYLDEFRALMRHTFIMVVLDVLCLFIIKESDYVSRLFVVYMWTSYFFITYVIRVLHKRYLRAKYSDRQSKAPAILIASCQDAAAILADFEKQIFKSYVFDAIFLTDYNKTSSGQIGGVPVLGDAVAAVDYATHKWITDAIICTPSRPDCYTQLSDTLCMMGITTHTIMAKMPRTKGDLNVHTAERMGSYIVDTQIQRTVSFSQRVFKRMLDILGGIVGCLITIILFIFVAPLIYIQSPGPIFYASTRIGKNGKPFKMYKFRSMYLDADDRKKEVLAKNKVSSNLMMKVDDDPRIIGSEKKDKNGKPKGIGNFIRETSIDEFPQFWSVLIGDMSLVGTRPPTPDEFEQYSAHHKARLAATPGITGLWQISGRSNITDFEEVVELDTEYIRTWTIWLDIKILWETVISVLKREGAE